MARELNALQRGAYETVKREGSIQRGSGWTLSTVRVLARRGLVDLEERRDPAGKIYFWRARTPAPRKIAPAAPGAPLPAGTHVVRVAVRNPSTHAVTYTQVLHAHGDEGVRGNLRDLGVPDRDMSQGSGGKWTSEDGRRVIVWRTLEEGALREFVCAGDVHRIQPDPLVPELWAVIHLSSGETVCAGKDPDAVEQDARRDAAAFHRAMRRG